MICEQYNLIKEGDFRNIVGTGITELSSVVLNALYDGDVVSAAVTVSGNPTNLGLLIEFGESYDLCYVDYYTDESDISNIGITYGTTSGTENIASVSLFSPGRYRGTIDSFASFVDLRHTVSGTTVALKQLEVIGTKNETLGFGGSKAEEEDFLELPHATVGTLSASPNVVPLFNDNHFEAVARVAVAPTFTDADNYLHIATTSTGTYYGIDDFGFRQPGPSVISLVHDTMLSASGINPQWELQAPAQSHQIVPTQEGILFDLKQEIVTGGNTQQTSGIVSKETFTAQSFTAEVDVRFTEVRGVSSNAYDFMFILTNGYPIRDAGYKQNYQGDGRRGTSTAGVALKVSGINVDATVDTLTFVHRYVDGTDSDRFSAVEIDNRFSTTNATGGYSPGAGGPNAEVGFFSLSDLDDFIFEGASLGNLTEGAAWHKLRLSYDHVRGELSGWVDHIFLGSRIFKVESFKEGCRLFIGMHTQSGFRWYLKNFRMYPNRVFRQRNVALTLNGATATATISGVGANVAKLIDADASTAYVGPGPDAITHVRLNFESPEDVTYYRLKQRDQGTGTVAFGETYYPDVARTAIVDFGGKSTYVNTYPNSASYVPRSPTYSGGVVICSGIEYLDLQFVDYDETVQANNALVIEEIEVYAEEWVDVPAPEANTSLKIPWVEGRWHNLKQYGTNSLAIKYKVSPEVSYWPFPEYMQQFVHYGFSSAVNGSQFGTSDDFHHSETLFSSPGTTGAGDYTQWHSDVQAVSSPFYIWRSFDTESNVASVFFDADTLRPSNVPDIFKLQYLRSEGDLNNELDWVDIPPVAVSYTNTSTASDRIYIRYRDYLIANNDGEFYTDYFSLPNDSEGAFVGFSVGGAASLMGVISDTVVPTGEGIVNSVLLNVGAANGLAGYIEFDAPVLTRGIRLVVVNPTLASGKESGVPSGSSRNDFALENLRVYRTNGAGVYTSPVFDTGSNLNTERVKATARTPDGTNTAIFVRSSSVPPGIAYDIEFEVWRSLGRLGSDNFTTPTSPDTWNRAIAVGVKVYYMFSNSTFVYDPALDSWSQENGTYPAGQDFGESNFEDDGAAETASPSILPDDRVYDNAALLDDIIYVAAYDTGNARTPRIMKLDLSRDLPAWEAVLEQRPPDSEFATMVAYDGRLYFFNEDGPSYYFGVALSNWIRLSNDLPVFGGSRRFMTGVLYNSKMYLFGGSSAGEYKVTIFDPVAETFEAGTDAPHNMAQHQAVLVEEESVVYVLPVSSSNHVGLKYLLEEDRWEYTESLMWSRDGRGGGVGKFYYYYDGYLYRAAGSNNGLSRALVRKPIWQHGKSSDFRDPVWGGASTLAELPWKRIDNFGELMPQNRYFQFKAELYSEDRVNTPVLEDIRIVVPQSITVPASGTANVFVKVGVSDEVAFQAVYSGETRGDFSEDFALLFTESADGFSWSYPVTASGVDRSAGTSAKSVWSPWVVQNSVTDYQVWYTKTTVAAAEVFTADSEIYYNTTTTLEDISGGLAVRVIDDGVISQTEDGVTQPCVIKESASVYYMWFTGSSSGVDRVFYAESTDGITWTNHQKVIDTGDDVGQRDASGVSRPCVLLEGSTYRMWYTGAGADGFNRILYRESTDRVAWSAVQLNLDLGSAGLLDERGASRAYVVLDSGTYYMYYFGLFDGVEQAIRAESTDGFSWGSFSAALPPAGLQGQDDGESIQDIFVLVNRNVVIPGEVLTTGKLKIHNEGAAL